MFQFWSRIDMFCHSFNFLVRWVSYSFRGPKWNNLCRDLDPPERGKVIDVPCTCWNTEFALAREFAKGFFFFINETLDPEYVSRKILERSHATSFIPLKNPLNTSKIVCSAVYWVVTLKNCERGLATHTSP